MKEDLLEIIENYGVIHQLKKFNEESYELIEAIRDYQEDYEKVKGVEDCINKYFKDNILEEFADVCVVLEQFKAYYDLDNEKIIETMKYKIERQIKRMGNENIK